MADRYPLLCPECDSYISILKIFIKLFTKEFRNIQTIFTFYCSTHLMSPTQVYDHLLHFVAVVSIQK